MQCFLHLPLSAEEHETSPRTVYFFLFLKQLERRLLWVLVLNKYHLNPTVLCGDIHFLSLVSLYFTYIAASFI
jgi:hypothetical protein